MGSWARPVDLRGRHIRRDVARQCHLGQGRHVHRGTGRVHDRRGRCGAQRANPDALEAANGGHARSHAVDAFAGRASLLWGDRCSDVTLIRGAAGPVGRGGTGRSEPGSGGGERPGAQIKIFFGSPRLRAWGLDCLHRKFLEIYGREKKSRFDLPVSVLRGCADHHDRSDLERI